MRLLRDKDFCIEEQDDKRTWGDELVPDCEKGSEASFGEDTELLPVLEYLGEFKALIDACGNASYYFNMKKFVKADVNKAKRIASYYNHDLKYYDDQLKEWRVKAERSYLILDQLASRFNYAMPEKKAFLNSLALSYDRRKAYKDYLLVAQRNLKTISPSELEAKFQKRILRRMQNNKC